MGVSVELFFPCFKQGWVEFQVCLHDNFTFHLLSPNARRINGVCHKVTTDRFSAKSLSKTNKFEKPSITHLQHGYFKGIHNERVCIRKKRTTICNF